MRGPAGVTDRLTALLDAEIATALRQVEAGDPHLADGELADAITITSVQPNEVRLDDQPAIVASVLSTASAELDDLDTFGDLSDPDNPSAPGELWVVLYRCRLEVHLTAPDVERADRWRYGWLTAIRSTLLAHRALPATADTDAPAIVTGAQPLFTEQFDGFANSESRTWTRALIDFPVLAAERLDLPMGEPVTSLEVRTRVVSAGEQLPDWSAPPSWHPGD